MKKEIIVRKIKKSEKKEINRKNINFDKTFYTLPFS